MTAFSTRAAIAPFLAMEVAREAGALVAAGQDVVRFDVGQPKWGAPEPVLEAARAALSSQTLGYTDGLGHGPLREAIAEWYGRTQNVAVAPGRIVVTTGASAGFVLAFLALLDTGDEVLLASPGYPPYRHILTALGFRARIVDTAQALGMQLHARHIASGPKAALIASPANPTGAMLPRAALEELAAGARAARMALISDEIYHGLDHAFPAVSALAVDPDAIIVSSFSKYWAMTGWRVGWLVAPEALIKPIERLAQNLFIAPPTLSQIAAAAALSAAADAICQERLAVLRRNREVLLQELPRLGLPPVVAPDGAFYVLVDLSAHAGDRLDFCRRALTEAGVAMTPGVDFCEARGGGWARIAYARETSEIEKGLARLGKLLFG
jgi:aspartate/methionine/tyrosine aminotransferase